MTPPDRRRDPAKKPSGPSLPAPHVPLHRAFVGDEETEVLAAVMASGHLQGGGLWMERAEARLRERTGARHALLMTSCTHALEAAAAALDIREGDEVIVPAWGFPTSASAFLRLGARVLFADSNPGDPGVDLDRILDQTGPRTRAIVVVHYAGRPVDVDALRRGLERRQLSVPIVEDAAQAFDAKLRGRACGTLGDMGCVSFHGTKNLTCGEGGLLLTDDDDLAHRVTLIREMGTDRRAFMLGQKPSYSWRTLGSSYLPPETSAAILCAQLEKADLILTRRRELRARYRSGLGELAASGKLALAPEENEDIAENGHLLWIHFESEALRDHVREGLARNGIASAPHYHPLDASPFGEVLLRGGRPGLNATRFHRGLLRLPIYPDLDDTTQDRVLTAIRDLV